jgi:hypothetical protein
MYLFTLEDYTLPLECTVSVWQCSDTAAQFIVLKLFAFLIKAPDGYSLSYNRITQAEQKNSPVRLAVTTQGRGTFANGVLAVERYTIEIQMKVRWSIVSNSIVVVLMLMVLASPFLVGEWWPARSKSRYGMICYHKIHNVAYLFNMCTWSFHVNFTSDGRNIWTYHISHGNWFPNSL